mgnify:CR=1 FL=1
MAKPKTVLYFIAEILVSLREDSEVNTFPFIFLWVDDNKAIDVYVEKNDGTYKYHITSPEAELVRDITLEQGPDIEEFALTEITYLDSRSRKVQKIKPGECTGCGLMLYDMLPNENKREAIARSLKRCVEDK